MLYVGGSFKPAKCSLIIHDAKIRGYHKCQLMPNKTNSSIIQNHRINIKCQLSNRMTFENLFQFWAVLQLDYNLHIKILDSNRNSR